MLERGRVRTRETSMPSLQQVAFFTLALLAVFIQSFVVQTHIHRQTLTGVNIPVFASVDDSGAAAESGTANQPGIPRDQFPGNGDQGNCPLCQGFAHSGQFVHAAAALAYIPAWVSVHFIVLSDKLPTRLSVSHSWQGRAPPQD